MPRPQGSECGVERGPPRLSLPPRFAGPPTPSLWLGVAGSQSASAPTPAALLSPSQHAWPGSPARLRYHPLLARHFLFSPPARAEPHTSVLELNQAVSLSSLGAKASPFGSGNLTLGRLLALSIPFLDAAQLGFHIVGLIHCSSSELSLENVRFVFLLPFVCHLERVSLDLFIFLILSMLIFLHQMWGFR